MKAQGSANLGFRFRKFYNANGVVELCMSHLSTYDISQHPIHNTVDVG